ncbi:uroporphyrinogen-III synthase [Dyella nitratireducens]|uniref:Uroporphyrinogen-III synthase n=1 Tax=Dyella nitratireducens TaxID=1849580 RepID=A0ABQ1GQ08_9GAMM|nr:uroporphyrinogen-III synthase [Dyella nitratireducens]GGA48207.1 uroporphyrinogen III methyltransferase [Dyella nitratireducens]GLQ42346.1 uroporphyrinogen III methyltransferase [Dyella nitratireducens]
MTRTSRTGHGKSRPAAQPFPRGKRAKQECSTKREEGVGSRQLAGCTIIITRPAGTGAALAKKVRALGGIPLLLPGLSLRGASDSLYARTQWRESQHDDVLIFSSPAAVRYALALAPFNRTHGTVIAVGQATARALQRHGITAQVPASRQDSEGVLVLPPLQQPRGKRVALVGAPGGRGLMQQQLAEHGAVLREVHVYRRAASRLTRRHQEAVQQLSVSACVLLSSAEALQNLKEQLPADAWAKLSNATAIVSSERIGEVAKAAGFLRIYRAASANQADLLAGVCEICSHPSHEADAPDC